MARQSIFKFNERVTTEAKDATYEFRGPVISVRNLEKKFGEHEVLKDISFDLFEGDVVCIIGSSGSGKSTLLRCINHLETPTSGQILYHGYPLTKDAQTINRFRSQVGMVFQQFNLFNNMTVFDNCMAGVHKVKKRSKEYSTEICMKYLLHLPCQALFRLPSLQVLQSASEDPALSFHAQDQWSYVHLQ